MKSKTLRFEHPGPTRPGRSSALRLAPAIALLLTSQMAGSTGIDAAEWMPDGQLKLPRGYHNWVFLGSPLTPHALNGGEAGFPEFHNVYIHPEAYRAYRETGDFPEGTILLKELQLTKPGVFADGSRTEPSGRGYFPAALNGIDISVKDSTRFASTNGWGFFNFGHQAPPYAGSASAAPKEACAACHIDNTENMVFMDFYRAILDAD